jgi:hypothetical protein
VKLTQLTLPLNDPSIVLAGFVASLKASMNRAAADHPHMSRAEILDRMNELALNAGITITGGNAKSLSLATFEKWLNPRDIEHVPSVLAVNVFCLATGDFRPLQVQLQLHGYGVLTEEDKQLRDYARAIIAEKNARKRKKALEAKL